MAFPDRVDAGRRVRHVLGHPRDSKIHPLRAMPGPAAGARLDARANAGTATRRIAVRRCGMPSPGGERVPTSLPAWCVPDVRPKGRVPDISSRTRTSAATNSRRAEVKAKVDEKVDAVKEKLHHG